MNTIKENKTNELIIKKSKFICFIYKINSPQDINKYLDSIKKEYNDATHIPYAYILENTFKYSDDNEPSSSAGAPMLNILTKNNITNTLVIVIRYFGGIKLGIGGLTRAYSKSVKEVIRNNIEPFIKKIEYTFKIPYTKERLINNMSLEIIDSKYEDEITYKVLIEEEKLQNLINIIKK